jgi:two-component system, chemotaxis family, CheB/CheR fusion protein
VRESLSLITALLRKRLKHDFSGYKQNTLIRRIQRRMQVLQIEAVSAYSEYLRAEPSEGDALFRELLIGVTQFFRDGEAFEALRANVLPSLFAVREADDPIRVWVAGCATGEEVYSIAILLQEVLDVQRAGAAVTIFATDIDPQAIAFARTARFRRLDGVSPERLQRWFVRDGRDYVPVHLIREMCVFSEHNLVRDPPFSRIDLISCRNVLIYMENDFQHRIMQTFHYALRPGGYLFLGPSESISRESRLFIAADKSIVSCSVMIVCELSCRNFCRRQTPAQAPRLPLAAPKIRSIKAHAVSWRGIRQRISSSTVTITSRGIPAARPAAILSLRKATQAWTCLQIWRRACERRCAMP